MHPGPTCATIIIAIFLALQGIAACAQTPATVAVQATPEVPRTPPVLRTAPVPKTPSVSPPRSASTDHARRLAKAFDDIDRDGNNLITGAEFARYFKTSSENTVFITYDRDRNYVIDRAEFYALNIDGKPLKPEKDGQIDGLRNPLYIHNQP